MNGLKISPELLAQAVRFGVVGVGSTVVDFLVYCSLLFFGAPTAPGKLFGAISGIFFSYLGNRFFAFKGAPKFKGQIFGFSALYGFTLVANVTVNEVVLSLLGEGFKLRIAIAFVAATGVAATLNFMGLKFFVFKANPSD